MNDLKMLDVKELQKTLKIGRNTAYTLMQASSFPSIQIGKKWLVSEEALKEWIRDHEYTSISLD